MFLNIRMRHAKLEVQKWRKVNLGVELRYVIDLIEFYFNSEFRFRCYDYSHFYGILESKKSYWVLKMR